MAFIRKDQACVLGVTPVLPTTCPALLFYANRLWLPGHRLLWHNRVEEKSAGVRLPQVEYLPLGEVLFLTPFGREVRP
jgi:hypothetical protein